MSLSAPIYLLKHQARVLAREEGIPLHQALNRIGNREGYRAWSLLSAQTAPVEPATALFSQLRPGELVLLGSRPGQGKTRLSLQLAIQAMRNGGHAAFFTLDFTPADVARCFTALGAALESFRDRFLVDTSDQICADYLLARLAAAPAGTLVVIDYLQLLDQRRENPELMFQVRRLKRFARERQLILVFLSQIDRSYDATNRPCPGIEDVRLPNPLDLSLFDCTCFLNQGTMHVAEVP